MTPVRKSARLSASILGILGALLGSASFADTGSVTVVRTSIYMGSTYPGMLVTISPAYPGLDGCSNTPGQYLFINFAAQTVPSGRDLYASVLAGYLAGHTIAFGTLGCSSDGSYPVVVAVNIDP